MVAMKRLPALLVAWLFLEACRDEVPRAPGALVFACSTDADCMVHAWRDCCGTDPMCVATSATEEAVQAQWSSVAFCAKAKVDCPRKRPTIAACACRDHVCAEK